MTSEPSGGFDVTEAFDSYAAGLYEYAHTILRDEQKATDAVITALVAADQHYQQLTEPELVHGWLYALLRAECLKWGPPQEPSFEPGPLPDRWTKRDEARLVVLSAFNALPGEQREIIDLYVRHQLTTIDRVLGLPSNGAIDLLSRATASLEEAAGAVVVARTNPVECPELGDAGGYDPVPPAEVRRLVRHVWSCPICQQQRPGVIALERLLELLPFAELPWWLRAKVREAATAPELEAARGRMAFRVEPLDERGWPFTTVFESAPEPEEPEEAPPPRKSGWPAIGVAAGACVLLAGITGFALTSSNTSSTAANSPNSETPDTPGSSGSPSDSVPGSPTKSRTPGATPTPSAKRTPTPTPSPVMSKSVAPTPPTHTGPPPAGSIEVSGCYIPSGQRSCTITVRAVGGPAQWSVSGTSGNITASGSGSLQAGETAGVTVSRKGWCIIGSGSGTVDFDSGASAQVTYTC